ncbi:MAG: Cytochrome [Acidimicrobiales bacterium]|nr:Cytochrome [Acidimicrobiales bacterium]
MQRADINLSDLDFWARPIAEREEAFGLLRADPELAFFDPPAAAIDAGRGYYALTRHADVIEASRQPQLFCSGRGTDMVDMPPWMLDFFGSMINMDDPRHVRMRRIVSRAFTPKMLASMQADVDQIAVGVVDDIAERGECDFVADVAARLPLRIIVDLMGIPRSQEQFIFDRTNVILGFSDVEYVPEQDMGSILTALVGAGNDLATLVRDLADERMRDPGDDLLSALVTAEVDGDHLSAEEMASFFILLVVAGNETTRNAIAHGLHALTEHPDQRARWQADFEALAPTAVEEIVRWATPVIHFRRTVTTDGARIGDHELTEGDKVVLFYNSANRDEARFDEPFGFHVARTPNEHVGFGGPGPHYCLGAHLARREITVAFRELFARLPDIHSVEQPDRLRSGFINGIKHLRAEFTPAAVSR